MALRPLLTYDGPEVNNADEISFDIDIETSVVLFYSKSIRYLYMIVN